MIHVDEIEAFLHPSKPKPVLESSAVLETSAPPSYLPPYIEFMLRAVSALRLAPDKRLGKAEIEGWLKDNWDASFGRPTTLKVSRMATFLRDPDQERGGLFRSSATASVRKAQHTPRRRKRRDQEKG